MASHGLFGENDGTSANGANGAVTQGGKGQALFKEETNRPQKESPAKRDDSSVSEICAHDVPAESEHVNIFSGVLLSRVYQQAYATGKQRYRECN